MTGERFAAVLARELPHYSAGAIEPLGEGIDFVAFLIDGTQVFRFAKSPCISSKLDVEAKVLAELEHWTDLAVPTVDSIATDGVTGCRFTRSRYLPGVPLHPRVLRSLPASCRDRAFRQITRFMGQLQAFPPARARSLGVTVRDFRLGYAAGLQRIRETVLPHVSPMERRYVEELYRGYLDDPGNFDYEPCLLHGDIKPEHVLLDPVSGRLTGIIDFADVLIGDPDFEARYLWDQYGEGFRQAWLGAAPGAASGRVARKVSFFLRAATLDVAAIGVRRGDARMVRAALGKLHREAAC